MVGNGKSPLSPWQRRQMVGSTWPLMCTGSSEVAFSWAFSQQDRQAETPFNVNALFMGIERLQSPQSTCLISILHPGLSRQVARCGRSGHFPGSLGGRNTTHSVSSHKSNCCQRTLDSPSCFESLASGIRAVARGGGAGIARRGSIDVGGGARVDFRPFRKDSAQFHEV